MAKNENAIVIKKIPFVDWFLIRGDELLRLRRASDSMDLRAKVSANLLADNYKLRTKLARWEGR